MAVDVKGSGSVSLREFFLFRLCSACSLTVSTGFLNDTYKPLIVLLMSLTKRERVSCWPLLDM